MRPAFLATSVPLPIAIPMWAALIDGASLTPSPVIATTSPFCLSVSTSSTLCSGATRPTMPIRSIRSQTLGLAHRGELRTEDRLPVDPELLRDRRAGDDVVTGDHPNSDVSLLGVLDGLLRRRARRVDHPHEARHLDAVDIAQQVAIGVERRRVNVADAAGHHAQALLLHPLDVSLRFRRSSASHGML